ncbi:MAG: methionyl-tRNA formyltransferase [Ekhidna sp.]
MSKDLRIIFLGTPDFASTTLRNLVENNINVVAVITAPDKPKGRGKKLGISAVKEYALEADLPILQPTNLKSPQFLEELKSYKADLQIVVAFRMLPVAVWDMPRLGTFNLHASLLPQYRGAAPINWAIINGEKETGVTTFFLKHEIDTGAIIYQEKEPIEDSDDIGSLYSKLMNRGADLVLKTVKAIEKGDYPQIDQEASSDLKSAPKIFKNDCKIDWNQSSEVVRNFIRGLSPYPAAWTELNGKTLKIFKTEVTNEKSNQDLKLFQSDGKTFLNAKTNDGMLSITELQLEGKKRMTVEEFLRGNKID